MQKNLLNTGFGKILHLVCNIYQAKNHVERGPECCKVLCIYFKDKCIRTFKPALGHGARIYFISKFRNQRLANLSGMGCRKPENCFVW